MGVPCIVQYPAQVCLYVCAQVFCHDRSARLITSHIMYVAAYFASYRPWLHRTLLTVLCLGALLVLFLALTVDPPGTVILATFVIVLGYACRSVPAALNSVVAVAFLLPFAVVPLDLGLKPTFLNIAVALVYLQWLVHLIRHDALLPPYTAGLVLLFGLLVLVASFWGLNFERPTPFAWRKVAEYLLNLGLFLVALTVLRGPQIRWLVTTVAITGVLGALAGLLLYVVPADLAQNMLAQLERFDYPAGQTALRYINDDPRGTMRAIGWVVDPNLLGASCVLSACLILPFVMAGRHWGLRMGAGLALCILLACIYLTYSRNALVALMAVTLFMALVRYRTLLPLGAGGVLLLLLLPQTQGYVQRLVTGLLGQDLATQMRLAEYRNALDIIRAYPWTGIGFFGTPSLDFQSGVSMIYLAVAAYMGLPALMLFLVILGQPLVRFLAVPWRHHDLEPYALGLAGTVIAFGMTGLFDHFYINLLYPHMSALFWVLLGACTACLRLIASSAPPSCPPAVSVCASSERRNRLCPPGSPPAPQPDSPVSRNRDVRPDSFTVDSDV